MPRPLSPDLPLTARMLELGFTRAELARRSGFNLRTIGNWTSGARRPSPSQYARLAEALACTPADIIDPNPARFQRPTNPTRRPGGTSGSLAGTIAAEERFRRAQAQREARRAGTDLDVD